MRDKDRNYTVEEMDKTVLKYTFMVLFNVLVSVITTLVIFKLINI